MRIHSFTLSSPDLPALALVQQVDALVARDTPVDGRGEIVLNSAIDIVVEARDILRVSCGHHASMGEGGQQRTRESSVRTHVVELFIVLVVDPESQLRSSTALRRSILPVQRGRHG